MKNILLIAALIFITNNLSAQTQIGLKFGSPTISAKSTSKDFFNKDIGQLYSLDYLSTKTSYSYGLSLYNEIGDNWWLSADVLYRKKEVNYSVDLGFTQRDNVLYQDNFKEVHIPITAGFRKNNFKFGLGPSFTIKADSQYSLTQLEGFTLNPRKVETGFQFTAGYIVKDRIHIDLKHELNFNGTGDDYRFDYRQIKLKSMPQNFSLSASIYL